MIHLKQVEYLLQDHYLQHLRQLRLLPHPRFRTLHQLRQMFPTPLHQVKLQQVLLLKLEQLIHQVNKRLDRVTLLVLIIVLIIVGLRDQVGQEEDTMVTNKY